MPLPKDWPDPLPFPWPAQPVTVNELPPDQRAMIGQGCDCNPCQDPCQPHPFVTCQLDSVNHGMMPASIANARKGDLILSPGNGTGGIGGLLGALRPPQNYTHMGIMVEDHSAIRHATASKDRVQAYPRGSILGVGVPAPVDGFDPAKIQFGWPGTITQSVHDAFMATQDPNWGGALYSDQPNPDSDHQWHISELSFDPEFGYAGDRRPALVVKPCGPVESQHPVLRKVAHRVADEALRMRGHYRFFGYTHAGISLDPAFQVQRPFQVFRSINGQWIEEEGTAPDPSAPCQQIPTGLTLPVVCSSFVWTAVQRVNRDPTSGMHIILDPDPQGEPTTAGCTRLIPPQPLGDTPDPSKQTPDGLYFYPQPILIQAGNAFNARLKQDVEDAIAANVSKFWDAVDQKIGFHVPPVALGLLLLTMASGVGPIASLLGISLIDAQAVIDFVTGMPDDVANQMCNLLAGDSTDEESTAWQQPGDGRAVSPDNIVWFWDATQFVGQTVSSTLQVVGLYGENRELVRKPPQWGPLLSCSWQLSPGTARLRGQVLFRKNNQPVKFAVVDAACRQVLTDANGMYVMVVPAGAYWATAGWQDPQDGTWWEMRPDRGQKVVLHYGQDTSLNFMLDSPPIENRQVEVHGKVDAVDRVAIGHDVWLHLPLKHVSNLSHYGNPQDPNDHTGETDLNVGWGPDYSDEGKVAITGKLQWHPGGSVDGSLHFALMDGSNVDDSADRTIGPIAPGASFVMPPVDLGGGEVEPDRAHIELAFDNKQAL